MMDATTIDKIERLALAAALANRLENGLIPAVLHDGKVLSLEHLNAGRARFRGTFNTTSFEGFIEYVGSNGKLDLSRGFIDAKKASATVFLNIGDELAPGHADWRATLELEPAAPYAALLAINGRPMSQREMTDFIEDWSANIAPDYGDGAPANLQRAISAIRDIKIKATSETNSVEKDFGAKRSALEEIEARSDAGIPPKLIFTTEPYAGFRERNFVLRLSIRTQDKPALILRIVGKQSAEEDIAQEFVTLLSNDLTFPLVVGSFSP